MKEVNINKKFINLILIFLIHIFLYSTNVKSETFISENVTPGCKFAFSNYFKNFVKIKNNNAIFTIQKRKPEIKYTSTKDLEVSIQITIKKINNPNSPSITLFMALPRGKKFGDFIIPNLRKNLCYGKFKKFIRSNTESKAQDVPRTSLPHELNKEKILKKKI